MLFWITGFYKKQVNEGETELKRRGDGRGRAEGRI
jgi:hypothetical protein